MNPVDTIFGLVVLVLSITGAVTILYHFMEWVFADKLYKIEEQELRDSNGEVWFKYTKYYKILGIIFKAKEGPFIKTHGESVNLKVRSRMLKDKEEVARLKASLKPVIKL
jgi:hypothetical protein